MKIRHLDSSIQTLLVAEIGNNHEGSIDVAHSLVEAAAESGAHVVKFQTFRTEWFVAKEDEERFSRLKSFELPISGYLELSDHAHDLDLAFISTPLDLGSVEELTPVVDAFKVASGDNDFYPLIDAVCATGHPLIISTGLTDLVAAKEVSRYVNDQWNQGHIDAELALLHCVSAYPTPAESANVRAIAAMQSIQGCEIGYSDHTIGTRACLAAVALGATIIEKHFTLDKMYSSFRDHQLSADPDEMREIVEGAKQLQKLLGADKKSISACEEGSINLVRRGIYAIRDLPKGHRIEASDLSWLRPRGEFAPGQESDLVGRLTLRLIACGEPFDSQSVEKF